MTQYSTNSIHPDSKEYGPRPVEGMMESRLNEVRAGVYDLLAKVAILPIERSSVAQLDIQPMTDTPPVTREEPAITLAPSRAEDDAIARAHALLDEAFETAGQ